MGLIDEIREQPDVVARLVGPGRADIDEVGRSLRRRRIEAIVIAARGSSDHAAIYAQYLFGVRQRLPVALAAPSIVTRWTAPLSESAMCASRAGSELILARRNTARSGTRSPGRTSRRRSRRFAACRTIS